MAKRRYTKREPKQPVAGSRKPRARKKREGSLTLERLRQLITHDHVLDSRKGEQQSQKLVAQCRDKIRRGDVFALFQAWSHCVVRIPPAVKGLKTQKEATVTLPFWLHSEVLMLLMNGMSGNWPTIPSGRAAPYRRKLDANRDLWFAWHTLKAVESGETQEAAFHIVAAQATKYGTRIGANAVEKAFGRVSRNLQANPDYYRLMHPLQPRILDIGVAPPSRG